MRLSSAMSMDVSSESLANGLSTPGRGNSTLGGGVNVPVDSPSVEGVPPSNWNPTPLRGLGVPVGVAACGNNLKPVNAKNDVVEVGLGGYSTEWWREKQSSPFD